MEILELRPTRLKLRHRPLGTWLTGALFIVMGLGLFGHAAWYATAYAKLTCDRPMPTLINCKLQRRNLMGMTQTLRIMNPAGAQMQMRYGSRGSRSYHIKIATAIGDVPLLVQGSGDRTTSESITATIQAFLFEQKPSLFVEQSASATTTVLSFLGLVLLIGGVYASTTPVTICTFYKQVISKVVIERQGWRGNEMIELPLNEIQEVDIEDRRQRHGRVYRVVLVTHTLKRIAVSPIYTDYKRVSAATASIRQFLFSFR